MRPFLFLLTMIVFAACSGKTASSEDSDSVVTDTSAFVDETDSTFAGLAEADEIISSVERLLSEHETNSDRYFTLRVSASGYEYRIESVWRFDSAMNLVYCFQDWASEGSEGQTHYLFQRDKLFAMRDENEYDGGRDIKVYHEDLGGVTYGPDSVTTPLARKFLTDNDREIKTQLSQVVQLLRDNRSEISKGDPAALHLENNSDDEEMPGKETTDLTIDRRILNHLIR